MKEKVSILFKPADKKTQPDSENIILNNRGTIIFVNYQEL